MKLLYSLLLFFLLLKIITNEESTSKLRAKHKLKNCNSEDDCYEYSSNSTKVDFSSKKNDQVNILVSSMDDEDSYNYVRNINCTYTSCPSPNYCIDNSICKCGETRANIISNNTKVYCQYKTKLQILAIILELVFPGAGHIYLLRYVSGIIKSLISIMTIYFFIYADKRKKGQLYLFIASMVSCTFLIYYIVDIYYLLINEYKDGNDVPLASFL